MTNTTEQLKPWPRVTLMAWTGCVMETLKAMHRAVNTEDSFVLDSPADLDLFKQIIIDAREGAYAAILEQVRFSFLVENVPVNYKPQDGAVALQFPIPTTQTHRRMIWGASLGDLIKRSEHLGCWHADKRVADQITTDAIDECARLVHVVFRLLLTPPCVNLETDSCEHCPKTLENAHAIDGTHALTPCALWMNQNRAAALETFKRTPHEARTTIPIHRIIDADVEFSGKGLAMIHNADNWTPDEVAFGSMSTRMRKLWGRSLRHGAITEDL